jgi:hypothetical protein
MSEPEPAPVTVFLTTAMMTSAGPGPGALTLPHREAGALVRDRKAVHGSRPPRGFGDRQDTGIRN